MARTTLALLAALAAPARATAQGKPIVEIGTNLGLTVVSSNGESITHFGIPGQGILGQPTIYASFYAGKSLLVEPQVALNIVHVSGETTSTLGFAGQVGYHFKGTGVNSFYLAGNLAVQHSSGGGDSTDEGLGAKIGYRVLAGSSVGIRFEGGYRRWFDSHLNEFTLGMSIGGILHR